MPLEIVDPSLVCLDQSGVFRGIDQTLFVSSLAQVMEQAGRVQPLLPQQDLTGETFLSWPERTDGIIPGDNAQSIAGDSQLKAVMPFKTVLDRGDSRSSSCSLVRREITTRSSIRSAPERHCAAILRQPSAHQTVR